ncbi:MAG: 30S ribosomal protein S6 [Anaerolineae bacterium]|nr:30S ribosomal protein S6 [Phycisphaerae bacterium]
MAKKASAKAAAAPTAGAKTRQYEAMFLFGAAFAPEVDKAVGIARGIIERHAGEVLVAKKWDERKLLYEITGNKRGLYVITYFNAPSNAIAGIERDVNLSEEVVRVLVTDADHLNKEEMEKVEPQPIVREERPSWERNDRFEGGGGGRGGYGGGGDRGDRGGDRGGDRSDSRDSRPPRRDDRAAEPAAKD